MMYEAIQAGARTVEGIEAHFTRMRQRAQEMLEASSATRRGYFTPSEDEQVFQLLLSYRNARSALLELIQAFRVDDELPAEQRPAAFLVAFTAALQLVDAARFLRESFHDKPIVRAKLNHPEPQFGIPADTYDTVQAALTSPRSAWHLYHAMKYYEQHHDSLRALAENNREELGEVFAIAERLVGRLNVAVRDYARARLRYRARQALTVVQRDAIHRALYGLQRIAGNLVSGVYTVPHHCPQLPGPIVTALRGVLQPGDVLVTRKEYALTNYFLPGFWPHAALYLGRVDELQQLGIEQLEHARPRWHRLLACDPGEPARVLEALKDGVRFRSFASPCGNDAIAVVRPRLAQSDIAHALSRSLLHENKLYDFDFDFTRADRLVCSEVVYRSYEGVCGIQFQLVRRAGRLTLAPEDLLNMALSGEYFQPVAAFVPGRCTELATGAAAEQLLRSTARAASAAAIHSAE